MNGVLEVTSLLRARASFEFLLLGVAFSVVVAGTGCFARSPAFDPSQSAEQLALAEQYVLERAEERWGYRRPSSKDRRPDYRDGFYIHAGGTTTCSGWLRKTQSTHVYSWVTEHSPTGRRVKAQQLVAGIDYAKGFFKGAGVSVGAQATMEVGAHDTISGYDEESICQCVTIFGTARIRGRLFLRVRDKICPDL